MPDLGDLQLTGVVLAAQANFYRVALDSQFELDPSVPSQLLCTRRSRLKKIGQQVVVGDRVSLTRSGERGVIESVAERRTFLPRPPMANLDQALVIFSLAEPILDPVQLSRFLVHAEASGLSVKLCLNKCDLVSEEEGRNWQRRLQGWGYDPLFLSALHRLGLDDLRQVCQGRISVATGLSGVGKSTTLNQLLPGLNLATQSVSGRLQHGRHTTRHVELFPLDPHRAHSGWIADSPGFNQADLSHCQSSTLIQHFPEARPQMGQCQFRDCLHQQEPGCQIRAFSWERYPIYLAFLEEILDREAIEQVLPDPEENLKYKPTGKRERETILAKQAAIPRLKARFRQPSRRQKKQQAQQWTGDIAEVLEAEQNNTSET